MEMFAVGTRPLCESSRVELCVNDERQVCRAFAVCKTSERLQAPEWKESVQLWQPRLEADQRLLPAVLWTAAGCHVLRDCLDGKREIRL